MVGILRPPWIPEHAHRHRLPVRRGACRIVAGGAGEALIAGETLVRRQLAPQRYLLRRQWVAHGEGHISIEPEWDGEALRRCIQAEQQQ